MATINFEVKLSKWFPCNDVLATKIARLCILREDLMFQWQCALESRNVPANDDYGSGWRIFSNIRYMFGTLQEIRRSIESLAKDDSFEYFMESKSQIMQEEFKKLQKNFISELKNIKTLRTEICVHIEESIVGEALQSMDSERSGILHISQSGPMETHYRFAGELMMSILFRNSPHNLNKAKEIIKTLENIMVKLFHVIDWIFYEYAKDRKLLNININ